MRDKLRGEGSMWGRLRNQFQSLLEDRLQSLFGKSVWGRLRAQFENFFQARLKPTSLVHFGVSRETSIDSYFEVLVLCGVNLKGS